MLRSCAGVQRLLGEPVDESISPYSVAAKTSAATTSIGKVQRSTFSDDRQQSSLAKIPMDGLFDSNFAEEKAHNCENAWLQPFDDETGYNLWRPTPSEMQPKYAALVFVAVAWQAGCAARTSPAPDPGLPAQAMTVDFVELHAGNTVVVVIPILRSGGYILPSLRAKDLTGGGRIEAGPDFLGYEQDFYTVKRAGNGVRVRFSHGVVWRNGNVQRVHAPRVALFEHMENSRVRLVFL